MGDVTNAAIAAQISSLITYNRNFIAQMWAKNNGSATQAFAPITQASGIVSTQPDLGWYPVTDPDGVVSWEPCPAKLAAIAGTLQFKQVQLNLTPGFTGNNAAYTLKVTDSGFYLAMSPGVRNTPITLTLPSGAPYGWNIVVAQMDAMPITFVTSGNDILRNRQNFNKTAGQYAEASVKVVNKASVTQFIISGDVTS